MPLLSRFFNIKIYMNWQDHPRPHIHAVYGDYEMSIDLNGRRMEGKMPPKQKKLIEAWIILHKKELEANWKRAEKMKPLKKIEPLK